jgi:hypothetical protein
LIQAIGCLFRHMFWWSWNWPLCLLILWSSFQQFDVVTVLESDWRTWSAISWIRRSVFCFDSEDSAEVVAHLGVISPA